MPPAPKKVLTDVVVQTQTIQVPKGTLIGDPVCTDNMLDCCGGSPGTGSGTGGGSIGTPGVPQTKIVGWRVQTQFITVPKAAAPVCVDNPQDCCSLSPTGPATNGALRGATVQKQTITLPPKSKIGKKICDEGPGDCCVNPCECGYTGNYYGPSLYILFIDPHGAVGGASPHSGGSINTSLCSGEYDGRFWQMTYDDATYGGYFYAPGDYDICTTCASPEFTPGQLPFVIIGFAGPCTLLSFISPGLVTGPPNTCNREDGAIAHLDNTERFPVYAVDSVDVLRASNLDDMLSTDTSFRVLPGLITNRPVPFDIRMTASSADNTQEQMTVTSLANDPSFPFGQIWTVTRGVNHTSAIAHVANGTGRAFGYVLKVTNEDPDLDPDKHVGACINGIPRILTITGSDGSSWTLYFNGTWCLDPSIQGGRPLISWCTEWQPTYDYQQPYTRTTLQGLHTVYDGEDWVLFTDQGQFPSTSVICPPGLTLVFTDTVTGIVYTVVP